LDSLVFSDRASINLDLKKFTTTGTGKAGIGASPALWEVNLTPITLGKVFQMLNSFQANNISHDAAKDLRAFYTGGPFLATDDGVRDGPSYIALRNVGSPGFDEKKWLDNRLFLGNTNMLQKLDNGTLLKGSLSYYNDRHKRRGFTATQYFTADQVIYNSEAIDNRFGIDVLDAGVLVEKNERQVYLRNSLKYHKRWNNDRGDLLLNETDPISQRKSHTDEALLNDLSMARLWGKQLVSIGSSLEWRRTPQNLSVSPGQFSDLLTAGSPYDRTAQYVRYSTIRWDNRIGFVRKVKAWRFEPNIALNYRQTDLDTYIALQDQQQATLLGQGYVNDMYNSRLQLSPSVRIGWESTKWKLSLSLPYSAYYFNVSQQGAKTLDNSLRNTFNPATGLTYIANTNHELSAGASAGSQYAGLDNFYNGFIMGQYNSMSRYDARLLRSENTTARLGYHYKNTLKANFANLSYRYSRDGRDYVFTRRIDAEGRSTTAIADRFGESDRHSVSGGVSRFFASVKTVVKLNGNLIWGRSDYLLNDVFAKQYGTSRSGSLEIVNSLLAIVSGEYKMVSGQTESRLAGGRNTVFHNNHYLNFTIYPHDQHSLSMANALYRNSIPGRQDRFFLDATYH